MTAIVIIGSILVALLAIYFFIAYFYFKLAVKRKDIKDLCNKEGIAKLKLSKYENILLEGRKLLDETPFEIVETKSFDGLTLKGRFYPVENAVGTLVFFHGYRATPLLEFAASFEFYRNRGMNVLLTFHRAHGESEGKYITYGVKERRDVFSWIDCVKNKLGDDTKIVLSGVSMGCATVLMGAGLGYPKNVVGIVADCGFTEPYEIIKHVTKNFIKIPFKPLFPAVNYLCKHIAGFDTREYSTLKALENADIPVLFVHGKDDDFVPPHMTEENYKIHNGEKRLLLAEGATHSCSYLVKNSEYQSLIENFILIRLAQNA